MGAGQIAPMNNPKDWAVRTNRMTEASVAIKSSAERSRPPIKYTMTTSTIGREQSIGRSEHKHSKKQGTILGKRYLALFAAELLVD